MYTKILTAFALLTFATSIYAQDTVTVDQQAYWRSTLRNNNSGQWDTIKNCAECADILLTGTVSDTFGSKESNRHAGSSDCDVTFNIRLDADSRARLTALQKKYGIKTQFMPELHVEVICANKSKMCNVCDSITAIPARSIPGVKQQVSVTGRLIIDKGRQEDADKEKSLPEFEIHPAYSIMKKAN